MEGNKLPQSTVSVAPRSSNRVVKNAKKSSTSTCMYTKATQTSSSNTVAMREKRKKKGGLVIPGLKTAESLSSPSRGQRVLRTARAGKKIKKASGLSNGSMVKSSKTAGKPTKSCKVPSLDGKRSKISDERGATESKSECPFSRYGSLYKKYAGSIGDAQTVLCEQVKSGLSNLVSNASGISEEKAVCTKDNDVLGSCLYADVFCSNDVKEVLLQTKRRKAKVHWKTGNVERLFIQFGSRRDCDKVFHEGIKDSRQNSVVLRRPSYVLDNTRQGSSTIVISNVPPYLLQFPEVITNVLHHMQGHDVEFHQDTVTVSFVSSEMAGLSRNVLDGTSLIGGILEVTEI